MKKYFCRIIAADSAQCTERRIIDFFLEKLESIEAEDISFTTLIPYYKIEGTGEMTCSFLCASPPDSVRILFADTWRSDCADQKWSRIHCPQTTFLWISL